MIRRLSVSTGTLSVAPQVRYPDTLYRQFSINSRLLLLSAYNSVDLHDDAEAGVSSWRANPNPLVSAAVAIRRNRD